MSPMSSKIRRVPDAALDMNAKLLISYKNVLAHIMRGADSRFAEFSVLQIRDMIGGDPGSDFLESTDKEIFVDGVRTE